MNDLVTMIADLIERMWNPKSRAEQIKMIELKEDIARAAIAFILAEMKTPRVQAVMETAKLDGLHYLDKAESAATLIIGRQVDAIETEVGDE